MFSRKDGGPPGGTTTTRERANGGPASEGAISIVGPGMKVVGDLETDGTVRIEGRVEGNVRAGKAVIVGREGVVAGDVRTQDAVIAGRVTGSVVAESRLELQATSRIEGDVSTRKLQLEEGGVLNGSVTMSDDAADSRGTSEASTASTSPAAGAPN